MRCIHDAAVSPIRYSKTRYAMTSTTRHASTLILCAATLADGTRTDVRIADGVIAELGPAGSLWAPAGADSATKGDRHPAARDGADDRPTALGQVVDLSGYLLVPSFVEPHAHLDKALTAEVVPNPSGDLGGAIRAWLAARPTMTTAEISSRAARAVRRFVARGTTTIRSHVDTGADIGTRAVEAVTAVRAELSDLVDIQIVALASRPMTGLSGAGNRAALADAIAAGADIVGGAPWIDGEPRAALDVVAGVAADHACPLDLHVDETLDPRVLTLPDVVALVERGFSHSVTVGHCVSLGVQEPSVQSTIAEQVAASGIAVVTLPSTNLFLQGRGWTSAAPRGLTALGPLLRAGARVAAGGDNVRDPFNPAGRADPLETASLVVSAGQVPPLTALELVTGGARAALGLPPVALAAGYPADLVAVRAAGVGDAVAFGPEDRVVVRGGRLVARTRVTTRWHGLGGLEGVDDLEGLSGMGKLGGMGGGAGREASWEPR
jgi:cytosine deaminase